MEVSKWSGGKQKQRAEGYMQNNRWMEGNEAIVERSPGNRKVWGTRKVSCNDVAKEMVKTVGGGGIPVLHSEAIG